MKELITSCKCCHMLPILMLQAKFQFTNISSQKRSYCYYLSFFLFLFLTGVDWKYCQVLHPQFRRWNMWMGNCLTIAACEHFNFFLTKHNNNLHVLQYCMKWWRFQEVAQLQFKYFSFGQNPPTKNFFSFRATLICSFLRTANIF